MDNIPIWLLPSGLLAIIAFFIVSIKYKRLSYDLEEYFLAGRRLAPLPFALSTSTVSLLAVLTAPHLLPFDHSHFSPAFIALGVIFFALTSTLFGRRLWTLAILFSPLTPTELLGDYYNSNTIRRLVTLIATLIACCLTVLSLHFFMLLIVELSSLSDPTSTDKAILDLIAQYNIDPQNFLLCLFFILALLFSHAAYGGMGAILTMAALVGGTFVLIFPLLLLAPHLSDGMTHTMTDPHILLPISPLFAFAGLALSPAALMNSFTARKARSLALQQFLTSALLGSLFPFLLFLSPLFLQTSLAHSALLSLLTMIVLTGLVGSSANALLAAAAMISDQQRKQLLNGFSRPHRKPATRWAIAALLLLSLILALTLPIAPMRLLLLAGAFGLQLLPALLGLCYFPSLTAPAIQTAAFAGIVTVLLTSGPAQACASWFNLSWPFTAWPLSIHPALWGLFVNLLMLLFLSLVSFVTRSHDKQAAALARQKNWHMPADHQSLMAPDAGKWRFVALLLLSAFLAAILLPLVDGIAGGSLALPRWNWLFIAWLTGLALVWVMAYRLQPVFDPEKMRTGSLEPRKQRFRVPAQTRKIKNGVDNRQQDEHVNNETD